MLLLDLTLDTPAENLALDEALLEAVGDGQLPSGVLRLWEAPQPMVVVGRGSRLADEVHLDTCAQLHVPVLRRVSGGMAIVAGPGCLMYAVVDRHAEGIKAHVDALHRQTLARLAGSLTQLDLPVVPAGTSDLALTGTDGLLRKVSGNSLRITRTAYLYHGTLLYEFDLPLVSRCLRPPPKSPAYRDGRSHADFVANLPLDRRRLADAIATAWDARENLTDWPSQQVEALVASRYGLADWNASR